LVTVPRCPTCCRTADQQRGNAAARGYCSAKWRKVRARKLAVDPFCSTCLLHGKMTPATDVDHLERVTGPNDPRFFLWEVLDSKCHSCHSRRTAVEHSTFAHRDGNITATSTGSNRVGVSFSRGHNREGLGIG
jgi:hypothetical protein